VITDLEEFRIIHKASNEFASGLREFRRIASLDPLLGAINARAIDEFVFWYFGTSRDETYKK
jgi:hypothetical protein